MPSALMLIPKIKQKMAGPPKPTPVNPAVDGRSPYTKEDPRAAPRSAWRDAGFVIQFIPIIPGVGMDPANMTEFRAFLNNFDDNYKQAWSQEKDMGRPDPKHLYNSFGRDFNLSFMVVGMDSKDLEEQVTKLNKLSQLTKPSMGSYSYNGVFVMLRIGEFIEETGYISALKISVDNESTPWSTDPLGDRKGPMPLYFSVSLTFEVLQDARPKWDDEHYGIGRYWTGPRLEPASQLPPIEQKPINAPVDDPADPYNMKSKMI